MRKVLTAEEMREVDRLSTEKYGIPSIVLMENAAHAAAGVISEKLGGSVEGKSFLILCGGGNNGGDGAALARILHIRKASVVTYLFGKVEDTKGAAKVNFQTLKKIEDDEDATVSNHLTGTRNAPSDGNEALFAFEETEIDKLLQFWEDMQDLHEFDVIIDCLFGTGLNRALSHGYDRLVRRVHALIRESESKPIVYSVDIPSGLSANSAKGIGENFKSDLTVTFTAPKLANVLPPASHFNGELQIANIGSPQELLDSSLSQTFLGEINDAEAWLAQTEFSPDSYKNKRGNVLLVVGSRAYSGAAVLAGNGAMQSGAGLVRIATPLSALSSISERVLPEVMVSGVAETGKGSISVDALEKLKTLGEKADVIGIGCGLASDEETTRKLVREIVATRKIPIVIDADGLNALAPFDLQGSEESPLILTPHEGEFLRLLGTKNKDALRDRVGAVRDFAQKHRVIVVLKGERTLIAEPGGKVVINPTGNPGLGKAGNGDNLTGIITGFVAQGIKASVDIFESVNAAVFVAGFAADIAARKFGKRVMLASDVRDCLVEAFKEIGGSDEKI